MTEMRFENGRRAIDRWDRVFEALSAEPRRQLIISLLDASREQSVSLPAQAMNPNVPADPERLRLELQHVHLPMLATMEFVEWETDPLRASRGPRFEDAAAVFEALHTNAAALPDRLVVGCQRLEREREFPTGE
ncbi:hypothetical protein [Natronolimnohabitans innermongolicus]|uniref:ArsR family transcriptional regulator n=1 Tax=Natronolimnohabitans innermongolicus JCM 12255 TaxID=1227499 RepID=L9X8F3_9EURY|nr:hypothetical protein [Natronolimnohabitans innermongolicus]ELY57726.1 hypothetical protein C493_07539 [Natronolimnohabitans innermongolicus JCM 12255]